jgi:hypothetical protein
MQIEYLTEQQIVSWGTVFQYDSRDNLIANSNINSFVTYPYTNVDYGVGKNDLGFISPLAGASAVILDIDVADESEYTASNVRVKVRPQAEGGGIINPNTGENIMSGEMEAVNLRGFQRSPSSKQVQVIVPVNINGTFDYAYEVSGELPLLRHIKIVGKISEFDVESLNQGTKISQLPFTEAEVDDMFVVSRCEDDDGRKFLATKEAGNKIPDFSDASRNYNASYGVSLYHLKQGLGMGAYCSIVLGSVGGVPTIDDSKSCFINCHLTMKPGGSSGAGTYQITTTNGLYKDKMVSVIASSSHGSNPAAREGGFLSVGKVTFERNSEPDTLPKIQGAKVTLSYNATVEITQYKPSFRKILANVTKNDDRKDARREEVYAPSKDATPKQYAPETLYVSFFGK